MAESEIFALKLREFAEKAPERVATVVRRVSQDVLQSVVFKTPVGNPDVWAVKRAPKGYVGGRLRANWNVALGTVDTTTTVAVDPSGDMTIARGAQIIAQADGTKDVFITNSLPYALPVEYGHSKEQTPEGMVRVTVAEFQDYVAQAVRA